MSWMHTKNLYIWIFNTGRGMAVCLRLPNNLGILYDLGSCKEFSPTSFVKKHIAPHLRGYAGHKIAQAFLSHPHADHISEVSELLPVAGSIALPLNPQLITCPNNKSTIEGLDYSRIENDDNKDLIRRYKKTHSERNLPLQLIPRGQYEPEIQGFEYGLYYMRPPAVGDIHPSCDQDYGNGVSLVVYVRFGKQSLLLPGDITPEVLADLLDGADTVEKRLSSFYRNGYGDVTDWHTNTSLQPSLGDLLRAHGLSVLVAPHHGLESCYSEELFDAIKGGMPQINVISDTRKKHENGGDVHPRYHSKDGAFGLQVDVDGINEARYGVSTKNGHHILVVMRPGAEIPEVYLRTDPKELLTIE